jgi:glycosyltransferase involved in cell wall biosynthesis
MGAEVSLFSTRLPNRGIISHNWSDDAMSRTEYLLPIGTWELTRAIPSLPFSLLAEAAFGHAASGERQSVLKDLVMCTPLARRLVLSAKEKNLKHIHAHSCGRAAMIAMLAHRMGGPPFSLTLHGPMQDYGPGQPFKWRTADFATVITRKLRAEIETDLAGFLPPKIAIQSMGVDADRFRRIEPYEPVKHGAPIKVFCCARLHIVKGHQFLIRAIAELAKRGVDVHLTIAGEDEQGGAGYHRELDALIGELGISNHVTLLGAVSEEEILTQLCAAHMFVLASMHEPLGVAYMEAMSAEVPTIGTDAGGVPELIQDGENGLLVPPKDPKALADAIARLATNPEMARQLSRAGRETILKSFRSTQGAETLYEMITGQAAQTAT